MKMNCGKVPHEQPDPCRVPRPCEAPLLERPGGRTEGCASRGGLRAWRGDRSRSSVASAPPSVFAMDIDEDIW